MKRIQQIALALVSFPLFLFAFVLWILAIAWCTLYDLVGAFWRVAWGKGDGDGN